MATSYGTTDPSAGIRYLLIDTDGVGSFGTRPDPGESTAWIEELVGPEGWARVRLNPAWHMSAYVNDCGLLMPDTYKRNVVGSVVLGTLGAGQQPYAGPVVITGWDEKATWRDEIEIRTLQDPHVEDLTRCLSSVRRVLGLEPGAPEHNDPVWIADVKAFAEHVQNGAAPVPTVITDPGDVEALLRHWARGGA